MCLADQTHREDDSSSFIDFAAFKSVVNAFAALMRVCAKELRDADFEIIRTMCLTRAGKKLRKEIHKTSNTDNLFKLLACNEVYFNWMNVEYLQTMAVASGNKKLEDLLKHYTDVILSKTLGEVWNDIPSFQKTKTKYYSQVRAKFHGKNPNDITIKDLKMCEPKCAEKIALDIVRIDKGSVTITWCILAEKTYQAYLLSLNVPQELRMDDFLQIGSWVVFHPQLVIQKLRKAHGNHLMY